MRPFTKSRDRLCSRKFSVNKKGSPRPCHTRNVTRIRPGANDYAICHMPSQMNALPTMFHIYTRTQPSSVLGLLLHARHHRQIRSLHQQGQFGGFYQLTRQWPGVIAKHHEEATISAKCSAHIGSCRVGCIQRVCQDECKEKATSQKRKWGFHGMSISSGVNGVNGQRTRH